MNIFRNTNLKWWQLELMTLASFGCGLLGAYYLYDWVEMFLLPIAFVTIVCSLYVTLIWWEGHKN